MTASYSVEQLHSIAKSSSEQRYSYCLNEIRDNKLLWILTDDDGCVMLNTEEEDCVPVWPSEAFANDWANGDWAQCKALSISLNKWKSRWTQGLLDDDLSLVIFPNADEEGIVVFPDDFEQALMTKSR